MTDAMRIAAAILGGSLLALAASACAQGAPSDGVTTFGSYGPVADGSAAGDGGSGGSTGSGGSSSDGAAPADPPADDPNTSTGDTGSAPVSDESGGSSDGAGEPPPDPPPDPAGSGAQPTTGMYAPCTMTDLSACGSGVLGCMYVETPGGQDGFCTPQTCANPTTDCDPAPGGTTVTPICVPVSSSMACALDCSSAPCPTGMQCMTLAVDPSGTMTVQICI